jgi:hypothetical protein
MWPLTPVELLRDKQIELLPIRALATLSRFYIVLEGAKAPCQELSSRLNHGLQA